MRESKIEKCKICTEEKSWLSSKTDKGWRKVKLTNGLSMHCTLPATSWEDKTCQERNCKENKTDKYYETTYTKNLPTKI